MKILVRIFAQIICFRKHENDKSSRGKISVYFSRKWTNVD